MAELNIIETAGLRKHYREVIALDGLDLAVPAGSIYGLLGRSGAGKTTAIKILMGMIHPTAGYANVFGLAADQRGPGVAIRLRTGFVDDERDLYESMTVEELIAFTAKFFPRWRADLAKRYVRSFELPETRSVKALSRGMRTKLAMLLALCRGAELLILDEATSGLDPAAAEDVLQALVGHVASEGTTVFFSSHQIGEVEQIADHVAVIDRGRTVLQGALDDLADAYRRIELVFDGDAPATQFQSPGAARVVRNGRMLTVLAASGVEQIIEEARALEPVSLETRGVSLKEIFLEIVSRER
ncbi:MAG TPA: ABC transporter ATP-binding protein [Steroidobacteraceae bacterium]|nr:ABC transporter ATP-binding protein [Steroidobacteraceae bacterium]